MGPETHARVAHTVPHPEHSALALIQAYSRRYGLEIKAAHGMWTITGDDLPEPVTIAQYTDMIAYLARNFGRI